MGKTWSNQLGRRGRGRDSDAFIAHRRDMRQ